MFLVLLINVRFRKILIQIEPSALDLCNCVFLVWLIYVQFLESSWIREDVDIYCNNATFVYKTRRAVQQVTVLF